MAGRKPTGTVRERNGRFEVIFDSQALTAREAFASREQAEAWRSTAAAALRSGDRVPDAAGYRPGSNVGNAPASRPSSGCAPSPPSPSGCGITVSSTASHRKPRARR